MINLGEFFIKRSVFLILLTAVFIFGGIVSFLNLNRNEDPGFKIRTASIISISENLSAEKMDKYVTRQIENELLKMEEIEDIKEESQNGKSTIYADLYEYYDDIQPIWDKLRRKVDLAKVNFPSETATIVNDEFDDVYGILIGVSTVGGDYEKLYDVTKNIRNDFLKLKNCGKAEIFGERGEVLYIYFKNSYLSNLKLTPIELQAFVDGANAIKGGGSISDKENYISINTRTFFENQKSVKSALLNINGAPISIGDIFEIEKTTTKPDKILTRANGKDALIIGISLKKDGNILNLGKEVKKEIKKLKEKYKGAEIEILAMQSDYVKTLTDKFTMSLLESVATVVLIVFLILGPKVGVIVGGIIFATIISSFLAMEAFNIGLDKISLSALIISLGILVDNSIVIAQGCTQNTNDNIKSRIISTVKRFQTPLFLVTLTTAFSFLPVFLAKSTVGEYASNLFKVLFIVLLFSWFYSVSLLPFLLYKFNSANYFKKEGLYLTNFFQNKITSALKNPKKVAAAGVLAFLASIVLFSFVPKIFFPNSDRNMFEIRLDLRDGTSFEETNRATGIVEDFIKNNKNITSYSSYMGMSAPRYVLSAAPIADKINFSMILANTKSYKTVESDILEVKNFINKNLPNVQPVVRKIPLGPPVDAPVEIRIINNDIDELFRLADIVSKELAQIDGVYLFKNNWGDFSLFYDIKVNENAAIQAGLNPAYIFDFLNTFYNGKILTHYYRNDVKIPVILKSAEAFSPNPDDIKNISIYSKTKGKIISINQVAEVLPTYNYSKILRRNNYYVLTVQAWLNEGVSSNTVVEKLAPKLNNIKNLEYEFGGDIEKSKKGNKSVTEKIPLAFGLILIILSAYFNNIKTPLLIGFCAILALTGANLGLFITHSDFGFMTFLGYICLVGICMNNGVVLVNEIKNNTENEILHAAKSRVEPILLTCLTTMGGMLPLWVKSDPMFSTLAISIIFGLLTSILITFFVLPSLLIITSRKNK